jgi:hypothetical protein
MKWHASALVTLVVVLQSPGLVEAGFLGHNLRDQELSPDTSTSFRTFDFLVGPGVELDSLRGTGSVPALDVSDTNILFSYAAGSGFYTPRPFFNGSRITDFNSEIDPILGVTINPATNMVGLDASRITFDTDNIFINFESLDFTRETDVSLDVRFVPAAVPEASTLALGGIGALVGLGVAWRRKRAA